MIIAKLTFIQVRRLFFVNKHVTEILRKNPDVIVMDCTYKTNKYRMPMLVIMGHTALGTSFYIGFAFLSSDEEEDFVWMLNQLKALYRHLGLQDPCVVVIDRDLALMNAIATVFTQTVILLCLWHINMNVLKHCKPAFETEEKWIEFYDAWGGIVRAPHEDEYKAAWKTFKRAYRNTHQEEIDYLKATWLKPHRRLFCKAWTNQILHFNTSTTSRIEGGH